MWLLFAVFVFIANVLTFLSSLAAAASTTTHSAANAASTSPANPPPPLNAPNAAPTSPRRGAIRIGNRKRRRGWLAISSITLTLLLATAITFATFRVRYTDLSPYKPTWWLGP